MNEQAEGVREDVGTDAYTPLWRQIASNAYDLLMTALLALAGQWLLRGAFRLWAEEHPDSLVDAWDSVLVASLWTVAMTPTLLVCAIAVAAHILVRARRPLRNAARIERAAGGAREERSVGHKTLVEFPVRRGISTGVRSVDLALHGAGWRTGLNGIWSSGLEEWVVTAFLLRSVADAQRQGRRCAWLGDHVDPLLAEGAGVDVSTLHVLPPDDRDPARVIEIAHGLVAARAKFDLVVVESLPALNTGWEGVDDEVDALRRTAEERQVVCVHATRSRARHSPPRQRALCSGSTTVTFLCEVEDEAPQDPIPDARVMVRIARCGGRSGYAATFDVVRDAGITAHRLTPPSLVELGAALGVVRRRMREGIFLEDERIGAGDSTAWQRLSGDPELAAEIQAAISVRVDAQLEERT